MARIDDFRERLELIKNTDFTVSEVYFQDNIYRRCDLLRSALLYSENKSFLSMSRKDKDELHNELDSIMKDKFRSLNPSLSEKVLDSMTAIYKQSDIICPMDIMVIDDMVINKEAILYEGSNNIDKMKTFMFAEAGNYFDVLHEWFTLEAYYYNKEKDLTEEERNYTARVLSYNINKLFGSDIVKPAYEVTGSSLHGLTGGDPLAIISLNMSFLDYGQRLKGKEDCDFKLFIKKGDDMTIYYIHQSFEDADPLWIVTDTNKEVWTLTDAIIKQKKNCSLVMKMDDINKK